MTFFLILICIKVVLLGAVYGRIDGGGLVKVSEWIERSLIMFFFVLACTPFAGLYALFAYTGVVGIATGHGQYFLARKLVGQKEHKERVDPIVSLFFGKDWRANFHHEHKFTKEEKQYYENNVKAKLYWRCVFGMFMTGSLVGLPAAIVSIVFGQYLIAGVFALTGVVKAAAYVFGCELKRATSKRVKETEIAEYANGGLRNVLCLVVLYLIL